MGQSPSLPSGLPDLALHVLRTAENSPSQGKIEPFFDYLIGLDPSTSGLGQTPGQGQGGNGGGGGGGGGGYEALSTDVLGRILRDNEGGKVVLKVYNAKSQRIRDVSLSPSRSWSADLSSPSLGLSLRVCNPAHALESVYHVLDVLEGSPAEMAGLVPWGDFVLAWSGGPLHSENDFYSLVESHVDKPLRLFVYNSDLDNLREVILYPTRQWGGEGLIGCGIGYGLLHRIPRPSTPPQTLFADEDYFNQPQPQASRSTGATPQAVQ